MTEEVELTITVRVAQLETSLAKLTTDLAENTRATKRVEENTKGLVGALGNLDGFNKVCTALVRYTKPLFITAVFALGIWKGMKTGVFPEIK